MKVYRMIMGGQYCAHKDILTLEIDIEAMEAGDKARIEVMDLTEEEYNQLPEFQGW